MLSVTSWLLRCFSRIRTTESLSKRVCGYLGWYVMCEEAGLKQALCCVQSGWGYAATGSGGAGYTGGLDGLGLDEEESGSENSEDSEDSEEE